MKWISALIGVAVGAILFVRAAAPTVTEERLARYRNLGKAFYENPTTQNEAVEEFRKALALAPNSARERLNYGLALLRAGKTAEGIAELRKVQKQDPSIPHTWFNLGIAYKKAGEQEAAIQQFEQIVKLVPDEPISHYNLGALYRLAGKTDEAIREFQIAAKLDSTLAAPHFQLFNTHTQSPARLNGPTAQAWQDFVNFGLTGASNPRISPRLLSETQRCLAIYSVLWHTPTASRTSRFCSAPPGCWPWSSSWRRTLPTRRALPIPTTRCGSRNCATGSPGRAGST